MSPRPIAPFIRGKDGDRDRDRDRDRDHHNYGSSSDESSSSAAAPSHGGRSGGGRAARSGPGSAGPAPQTGLARRQSTSDSTGEVFSRKPKRTYRACLPCRSRKLKCDLGDPDAPSEGPCRRCRRESRDCIFNPRPARNFELLPSRGGGQSAPSSGSVTPADPTASNLPIPQHAQQQPPSHLSHVQNHHHSQPALPPVSSGPHDAGSAASTSAHVQFDVANPYGFPLLGMAPGSIPAWAATPSMYSPHHAAAALMAGTRLPSPSALVRGTAVPQFFMPSPLSLPTRQLHPTPTNLPAMTAPTYIRPALPSRASGSSEQNPHGSKRRKAEDYEPPPIDEGDEEDELDGLEGKEGREDGVHGGPVEDVTLEEAVERARGDRSRASSRNRTGNSRVLLASTLHNPSDALRLLATASSLRSTVSGDGSPSHQNGLIASPDVEVGGTTTPQGGAVLHRKESHQSGRMSPSRVAKLGGWSNWAPIAEGLLTQPEAEVLFSFFEAEMAPLYPLLSPNIFHLSHLAILTSTESLLLCAVITIAARYSAILLPDRAAQIHALCAAWIRQELIYLLDGTSSLRHISSVEALLLLTEWPSSPLIHRTDAALARQEADEDQDEGERETSKALKTSNQYDSMSWTYLGLAVRLAQELGMHNTALYGLDARDGDGPSWESERILRAWIYCYNADRHVSVRLGRNAVVQSYMSSAWWEKVTQRASLDVQKRGLNELWAERTLPQGLLAALMGTIQERLYPNKEITRSLLRTGHWESFIRSLDHELRSMATKTKGVLKQGNVESTLLRIEIDYIRLYGNAIALRALQERLRRRVKANDLLFVSPSLLNLQEGPWIIDALAAAQAILQQTVIFLEPKGYLRLCPSRIFQRIMFAATFLFKALAVGVVEHGQSKTIGLLEQGIAALRHASVDAVHISRGFSVLLTRLQAQCVPAVLAEEGLVDPTQPSYPPSPRGLAIVDDATVQATMHGLHGDNDSVLGEVPIDPATADDPTSVMKGATPSGGTAGDSMSVFGETINMHGPPDTRHHHHAQNSSNPHPPHQGNGTDPNPAISTSASEFGLLAFDLPWQWDPTLNTVDVGKEQDTLFASIFAMNQGGNEAANHGDQLGLFGTLVGDDAF
ncbi:BQ5605_C008g05246 [Microbotryum silenes-dioicae]|uniref:BQ5605_C008g05246 protein n=1 Tax=Microbotryum silenes-dioicae TaxID=796604 RepID=A0A2X0MCG7_9BASI|nr:BQ5605_C008g05246 [Microbotryum silenes-dioicae]